MREIPLTHDKVAIVDDEDYEFLSQYKWYATRNNTRWYAVRNVQGVACYMHRVILGLLPGDNRQCDHRNGDGLINTRDNLRIATVAQNRHNSPGWSAYGIKGVYFNKGNLARPWAARIIIAKTRIHLGCFKTINEAAIAYDKAALDLFGCFAKTNFCRSNYEKEAVKA